MTSLLIPRRTLQRRGLNRAGVLDGITRRVDSSVVSRVAITSRHPLDVAERESAEGSEHSQDAELSVQAQVAAVGERDGGRYRLQGKQTLRTTENHIALHFS